MISHVKRISLSAWIFLAMVAGILFGWLCPSWAVHCEVVSTMFLNLVKCIVVPLLVSTLIVGIAGHADDLKVVGRLALRSLIYFEIVTTAALLIGLAAVNIVRPGDGVNMAATTGELSKAPTAKVSIADVIEHLAPKSFFDAAARNDVLQVVIFAIIFAIAMGRASTKSRLTILNFCEAVSEVMFKFTGLIMWLAPLGVGAAIACTIGKNGLGVVMVLLKLVLTLYGALVVFILLVLIPVMLIARIPVVRFLKTVREPFLLAFSTASSEAALPDALRLMEKFGVPKRIVSFVLPMGYSFNLDGSTLYLALASVFVAQAAGIELTLGHQIAMMLTLMLTSKGVAAVPRASLIILSGTLATFKLPTEGVAVILGVDAFLDMARTSVNLLGNCLASAVMARWEGELKLQPETASSTTAVDPS